MLKISVDRSNPELSIELCGDTAGLVAEFAMAACGVYASMLAKDPEEAAFFFSGIVKTLGKFDSKTWSAICESADLIVRGGIEEVEMNSQEGRSCQE